MAKINSIPDASGANFLDYTPFTGSSEWLGTTFTSTVFVTVVEVNGEGYLEGVTAICSNSGVSALLRVTLDGSVIFLAKTNGSSSYGTGVVNSKNLHSNPTAGAGINSVTAASRSGPINYAVSLPHNPGEASALDGVFSIIDFLKFSSSLKIELKLTSSGGANLAVEYHGGVK